MKRQRLSIQFSFGSHPKSARGTELAGSRDDSSQGSDSADMLSREQGRSAVELQPDIAPSRLPFSLLITDDDDAFRETLRSIFEPEGFHTLLAHSGEEALDIVRGHRVHLAMLDQNLPRLTGLETLRIIRQMNAMLPVILMTAGNTQQLLRDALSAQAFCVMSKPMTRNVVVYTVHQALSRSYDLPRREFRGGETNL